MNFDPVKFFEVIARAIPPELLELYPTAVDLYRRPSASYRIIKRIADVVVSILLLILTGPLWIFASLGIFFSDGPRVFFVQSRLGQDGRLFRLVKFRTLQSALPKGTPTTDIGDRTFTFGSFLRKTRIDELPQLLQVISGRMSLVGPRPEMVYYHQRSVEQIPYYSVRLAAKPGMTGWAQVKYVHTTTEDEYRQKTAHDLWYIANRSLFLDVRIALRTIGVLVERFGSK